MQSYVHMQSGAHTLHPVGEEYGVGDVGCLMCMIVVLDLILPGMGEDGKDLLLDITIVGTHT